MYEQMWGKIATNRRDPRPARAALYFNLIMASTKGYRGRSIVGYLMLALASTNQSPHLELIQNGSVEQQKSVLKACRDLENNIENDSLGFVEFRKRPWILEFDRISSYAFDEDDERKMEEKERGGHLQIWLEHVEQGQIDALSEHKRPGNHQEYVPGWLTSPTNAMPFTHHPMGDRCRVILNMTEAYQKRGDTAVNRAEHLKKRLVGADYWTE
ncbi:hypothetical protein MCOR29_000919 [Pyricularia oryzae]|uniref:Uncharacterized protein n=1 Tax=Pyricularia grisea TaxID=148305 RepID=A0ABQ8NQ89_PYRGI|nr:hypothetical protein MCOR33_003797 [Pyricularia grisea]KAI6334086.1 hypothetical protein MCOR29_000919 [Pyricularia oryzae]KAI6478008.1 hypothetical protein MCOR17_000313 [Pyricularia oryzae]KAI6602833.1 hypothetical protein MCOR04_001903 [Pyricularia oryzae]